MGDTETTAAHAGHLSIHHIVEVENEIMTEIVPLITQVLVIAGTGQGLQNIHPIGDSVTWFSCSRVLSVKDNIYNILFRVLPDIKLWIVLKY